MADVRLSTPVGTAVYPRLKTPDTKFDELGAYKADLAVPLADAEPLIEKLQAIHKEHTGKVAPRSSNTMFKMELDDSGNETGNVIFKISVKNRLTREGKVWDRRPKLFDAALKPIDVNPWGGTKMVVSFDAYTWVAGAKKGVSLQPVGVQIIELKSGDGGGASAMGFSVREGFVAPEEDSAEGYGLSENIEGDEEEDSGDY